MGTALSRNIQLDVTSDLTLASGWLKFPALDDFNDSITPNTEETTSYDTTGWKTNEVTLQDWSLSISAFKVVTGGVEDPAQRLVRLTRGQFGTAARIGVRWYSTIGLAEAWQGVALPTWNKANTGVAGVSKIALTFMATDLPLTAISNPYATTSVATLISALPSGAGVGALVSITGVGFTGTTGAAGVKFGGVNATNYVVSSDNLIVATMPAGSAGSAPVIVTNPVGASAALPYTRT